MFSEDYPEKKALIYDNAPQFTSIDYDWYNISGINISPSAPNMKTEESKSNDQARLGIAEPTKGATPVNAFTERVIGTIRREALDHFLLFSRTQVRRIIREYVDFYNHHRPHQSIEGIPEGNISRTSGNIKKESILGGLHHNYYRSSA